MNDPQGMRMIERRGDLVKPVPRPIEIDGALVVDDLAQIRALDELRNDDEPSGAKVDVVDAGYVRVRKARQDPRFPSETLLLGWRELWRADSEP